MKAAKEVGLGVEIPPKLAQYLWSPRVGFKPRTRTSCATVPVKEANLILPHNPTPTSGWQKPNLHTLRNGR